MLYYYRQRCTWFPSCETEWSRFAPQPPKDRDFVAALQVAGARSLLQLKAPNFDFSVELERSSCDLVLHMIYIWYWVPKTDLTQHHQDLDTVHVRVTIWLFWRQQLCVQGEEWWKLPCFSPLLKLKRRQTQKSANSVEEFTQKAFFRGGSTRR